MLYPFDKLLKMITSPFMFLNRCDHSVITSRGLSRLSWRTGLSLVRVVGAVQLDRPQVEHNGLLYVVYHRQTVTVAEHHPEEGVTEPGRRRGGGGGEVNENGNEKAKRGEHRG